MDQWLQLQFFWKGGHPRPIVDPTLWHEGIQYFQNKDNAPVMLPQTLDFVIRRTIATGVVNRVRLTSYLQHLLVTVADGYDNYNNFTA